MKALIIALAIFATIFRNASAEDTNLLIEEFKEDKFELLHSLNQRYIAKFEKQKQQAMQQGDLINANAADRLAKEFRNQQEQLEAERNHAKFIASLAGDWRVRSSDWSFKILTDGSVTSLEPARGRGRISVIDYKKRTVRMTGFSQSMTWMVTEGAKSLFSSQHPAERITVRLELEDLLKKATEAAKPGPHTAAELAEFLHGTTWNISNGTKDSKAIYTMTFNKDGTFTQSDGRTGKLEFLSARKFKLWNYDPAVLDDNLKQFQAIGAATVYFGNLQNLPKSKGAH